MSNPIDRAWSIVLAAACASEHAERGETTAIPDRGEPVVEWRQDAWQCVLPADHEDRPLIDLYLPFCSATASRPMTLGHLGESLDGFIATHTGDSQWVTGPENLVHMHRLRALCDAVVVGAGTVAADDPQLTTRLVSGANPLRVVLDPGRRLSEHHRVFAGDGDTLFVCARDLVQPGERLFGRASILGIDGSIEGLDIGELMRTLRARGCHRVFVEGGGITISMFLQSAMLDRLHLAIAPLLIGDGRPAIRLPAPSALGECHRPNYRVFRMGGDVLFDCDLRSRADDPPDAAEPPAITRVI